MKILIGWEDTEQVDLMTMYLGAGDNDITIATSKEHFSASLLSIKDLSVVLLSTRFPDLEASFELFKEIRALRPQTPIVCGCMSEDIYRLARYMKAGMKSYILRDPNGDFLFLLNAMMDSVVESVQAEREQKLAEKLREEVESVRKLQETIVRKTSNPLLVIMPAHATNLPKSKCLEARQ